MSDLTTFRDHARRMSEATHKPECVGQHGIKERRFWTEHGGIVEPAVPPWCLGCVTDADRALWARLADEADAWLARNVEDGLWHTTGDASPESEGL